VTPKNQNLIKIVRYEKPHSARLFCCCFPGRRPIEPLVGHHRRVPLQTLRAVGVRRARHRRREAGGGAGLPRQDGGGDTAEGKDTSMDCTCIAVMSGSSFVAEAFVSSVFLSACHAYSVVSVVKREGVNAKWCWSRHTGQQLTC